MMTTSLFLFRPQAHSPFRPFLGSDYLTTYLSQPNFKDLLYLSTYVCAYDTFNNHYIKYGGNIYV